MSIISFLFKPKKNMAKKDTKRVKVGKYTITKHAQKRIVDESRHINKFDVLRNLFTKPNGISKVKYEDGKPSYNRVGKQATTIINPTNNNVVSCRPISRQDRRDFDLVNISKKGRKKKYVKRNSKKQIQRNSKKGN